MTFFDHFFAADKSYFDVPVSDQENFLKKLGKASSDLDRSYKQYRSQLFFYSHKKRLILSTSSFVLLIFLLPYYIIRGLFIKKGEKVDAICRADENAQFIPDSLLGKYVIDRTKWDTKGSIYWKDIPYIISLCIRYFFNPYFTIKVLFKVSKYSSFIHSYNPRAIIVNDEFSFTSSAMTSFCERYGVLHINVQHGEKLYIIRDSYFRFHECYVWDNHYRDLFISMNSEPSQFVIELPESMKFDVKKHFSQDCYADYKYYLTKYDEKELLSIINAMSFAAKFGKSVKFRPHPNYSDIELLRKYVSEESIELPNVNIIESISSTQNVVGVHSTVLTQAYFNNRNVIIDDVSCNQFYKSLSEMKYILMDKVKNRLSSCQLT